MFSRTGVILLMLWVRRRERIIDSLRLISVSTGVGSSFTLRIGSIPLEALCESEGRTGSTSEARFLKRKPRGVLLSCVSFSAIDSAIGNGDQALGAKKLLGSSTHLVHRGSCGA